VTYGSGEHGEDWIVKEQDVGELVFGYDSVRTPAATSNIAQVALAGTVHLTVGGEDAEGTHWGHGVAVLKSEQDKIRKR